MTVEEKTKKRIKLFFSAVLIIFPVAVYLLILKLKAGNAVLYSAPSLVIVSAVSLFCAFASYAVMSKNRHFTEDEKEAITEAQSDSTLTPKETPDAFVNDFSDEEEYPELFSDYKIKKGENENEEYEKPDIASVIMKLKEKSFSTEDINCTDNNDTVWDDYLKIKQDENEEIESIYKNLTDELPYDYKEQNEGEEEEITETVEEQAVKIKMTVGETLKSKIICVLLLSIVSLGFAVIQTKNTSIYTQEGFVIGKNTYTWADAQKITVSQRLSDTISIKVETEDGRITELYPTSVFKGRGFSEKYDNVYEYYSKAVDAMMRKGSEITVNNEETIKAHFIEKDKESYRYIEEIMENDND